jgi:hypothetical protein
MNNETNPPSTHQAPTVPAPHLQARAIAFCLKRCAARGDGAGLP